MTMVKERFDQMIGPEGECQFDSEEDGLNSERVGLDPQSLAEMIVEENLIPANSISRRAKGSFSLNMVVMHGDPEHPHRDFPPRENRTIAKIRGARGLSADNPSKKQLRKEKQRRSRRRNRHGF